MSRERRLAVILGGLVAAFGGLLPALHLHHAAAALYLVAMLAAVAVQIVLVVRVRLRGECACPPLWQRFRT